MDLRLTTKQSRTYANGVVSPFPYPNQIAQLERLTSTAFKVSNTAVKLELLLKDFPPTPFSKDFDLASQNTPLPEA